MTHQQQEPTALAWEWMEGMRRFLGLMTRVFFAGACAAAVLSGCWWVWRQEVAPERALLHALATLLVALPWGGLVALRLPLHWARGAAVRSGLDWNHDRESEPMLALSEATFVIARRNIFLTLAAPAGLAPITIAGWLNPLQAGGCALALLLVMVLNSAGVRWRSRRAA